MVELKEICDLKTIKKWIDKKNLSRIYGFILYTNADGILASALKNEAYWTAFDDISGERWPIFTVRQLKRGNYSIQSNGSDGISFMTTKWYEPPINMDVLDAFDIKSTEDLPCFVAFIWDDNNDIRSITVDIKGKTEQEVYHNIVEIISAISRTEEAVEPRLRKNVELFRNVEDTLNGLNFKCKVKTILNNIRQLKDFFSLFRV